MFSRSSHSVLAVLVLACCALIPALPARADPGVWGPGGLPFSNGVLCDVGSRTAALVAWLGPTAARPAFALQTVTAPVAGATGKIDSPADATGPGTPVDPTALGLSDQQVAALAYLIASDGTADDPATVAEVAALVSGDPTANACLQLAAGGTSAAAAQALMSTAADRAGPYQVTITASSAKITLGQDEPLTVQVRSASGVAVPGLHVRLAADDPTATLETADPTTDSAGRVQAVLQVPSASRATSVGVRATVLAPTGLVEFDEVGSVSLVTAAPDQAWAAHTALPVDTTAQPALQVHLDSTLVLPGASVHAQVDVTGMHGHLGRAALQASGPLPFRTGTGCRDYTASSWTSNLHISKLVDNVPVTADSGFATMVGPARDPGCYLVQANLTTVNAVPVATAESSTADTGAVIAVAPVSVRAAAPGHGIAVLGRLHAALQVGGTTPATITQTDGSLAGPLPARRGSCPTTGWNGAATAGAVTDAASDTTHPTGVDSAPVTKAGCYRFELTATLTLPGIGTVNVPSVAPATVLVLDPALVVSSLARPSAYPGGSMRAQVSVYGTLTQHGIVQLRLARLRDDSFGCFDQDYSRSTIVAPTAHPPQTRTLGDGSYEVTAPVVPSEGCWTVVPTLTLDADPAIHIIAEPGAHTMTAFTVVQRPATLGGDDAGPQIDSTVRLVFTAVLIVLLLGGALVTTVRCARRDAEWFADEQEA